MTETAFATKVFRVHIKASAEAIWAAITQPEWNRRYGYLCPGEYDLRPGGGYRASANAAMKEFGAPDVILEGTVVEVDPPRRLVQTWRALFNPEVAAEGETRVTFEIEPGNGGVSALTVTHELGGAPMTAGLVSGDRRDAGGGWPMILSDLKTLLETGSSFQE